MSTWTRVKTKKSRFLLCNRCVFTVRRPLHTAVFVHGVVSTQACTLALCSVLSCAPAGGRTLTLPLRPSPNTSRIDQKMSNSPSGYKLQDAQAILSEVRSIRDAISCGEREKQELMQVGTRSHHHLGEEEDRVSSSSSSSS